MERWGKYTNHEFQKWYFAELKRQKVKFGEYDLPDAYSDWLENFANRRPPEET